ncbi:porin family protein [Hymenobacter algoricola]|uniref:Outer membrane protein beta-barrel domain-containing protein n=1 Tax=Hymenobacter algoricola TaxID=486267 RepID=A0ABP7NSX5_9BACT
MKKLLLPLTLFSTLPTGAVFAQQSVPGLRGGINSATYAGSANTAALVGGLAGVTVTTPLNQAATFAFQTELLYAGKGSKLTGVTFAGIPGLSGTQRLHYLELPLLVQYRPHNFELEAGPQVGMLLAQQTELSDGGKNRFSSTGTGGLRTFEAGYILSAGYRLPQGLGAGLRYNRALSGISGGRLHNSVIQLQLSYQFRKNRTT